MINNSLNQIYFDSMNHHLNMIYSDGVFLTNETSNLVCETVQYYDDINQFISCYKYFANKSLISSFLEIVLIIGVVFLNFLVIFIMLSNRERLTVFDQILVGHCFVNGITGFVDIPLYHIYRRFGYWPLGGSYIAYFWTCFDNSINFITSMHMLYASYARLKSIECPITEYRKYFLISKPVLTCLSIWVIGLAIWIPIVCSFGIIDYTLEINYSPYYFNSIINFITWLLPLTLIFYYSVKIVIVLYKSDRKRFEIRSIYPNNVHLAIIPINESTESETIESSLSIKIFNNKLARKLCSIIIGLKYFVFRPQGKFSIIMGSYWFQWIPPCLLTIFGPLINNMPVNIIANIYWLTYTPCITDPLSVILCNRKVKMTPTTLA